MAKLKGDDPPAHLADILAKLLYEHPINRIANLVSWRRKAQP